MAERLHRTQILLEPAQHEALTRLARAQGRSLSNLVRDFIRKCLADQGMEVEEQDRRFQEMLEGLQARHARILERRGGKPLDLGPEALDALRQEQDERNLSGLRLTQRRD